MAGSRRTLTSYVRGELGTEGQRFLRGDATGVVALEFREADGTHFVHGAVVDAYEDGRSPDIAYFVVNGAALNDDWFFRAPGKLYDSRAFRRHLEHFALPGGRAHLFTRLEDYRFHLLNRLGQLKETFPAKIVKGLAFSPLTNIRDFVHNYLLDENLVDVQPAAGAAGDAAPLRGAGRRRAAPHRGAGPDRRAGPGAGDAAAAAHHQRLHPARAPRATTTWPSSSGAGKSWTSSGWS